jgi:hypothetical protein
MIPVPPSYALTVFWFPYQWLLVTSCGLQAMAQAQGHPECVQGALVNTHHAVVDLLD